MDYIEQYMAQRPPGAYNMGDDTGGNIVLTPALFHYTTYGGFLGIVKSEKIWATNIHYLNDYTEYTHAYSIMKRYVEAKRNLPEMALLSPLYERICAHIEAVKDIGICVASFSEKGDVLSQWRGYAGGSGVSIGFKYNDLLEVGRKNKMHLMKCIYKPDTRAIVEHLLCAATARMSDNSSKGENFVEQLASEFIGQFCRFAAACKHSAFEEEAEWRLISPHTPPDDPRLDFRTTSSMLVPHLNVDLRAAALKNGKKNIGISRIIVGPTLNKELAMNSISNLLFNRNINWSSIEYSDIPYRTSI